MAGIGGGAAPAPAGSASRSDAISTAVRHRSATPGMVLIAFSTWKPLTGRSRPGGQVVARRVERRPGCPPCGRRRWRADPSAARTRGSAGRTGRRRGGSCSMIGLQESSSSSSSSKRSASIWVEQHAPIDLLVAVWSSRPPRARRAHRPARPGARPSRHRSGPAIGGRARGCPPRWRGPGRGGSSRRRRRPRASANLIARMVPCADRPPEVLRRPIVSMTARPSPLGCSSSIDSTTRDVMSPRLELPDGLIAVDHGSSLRPAEQPDASVLMT